MNLFDIKTSITRFSNTNGKLNKLINSDGSKVSRATIYNGNYETLETPNLSTLKAHIDTLKDNQCLCLGINKYAPNGSVATLKEDATKARTKDNFQWNNGNNIVLLDYDYFDGLHKIESLEDFRAALIDIEPMFNDVEMLILNSSSAGLYKDDKPLNTGTGLHCYIMINGSVEDFKNTLWINSWSKGYGAIKLAKDGKVLSRSIFDKAVFSPERLVFEARPTLSKGITQDDRECLYIKGNIFDVSSFKPIKDGINKEQNAINNAAPLSDKTKKKYIKEETKKLIDTGVNETDAKAIIKNRVNFGTILTTDKITLTDGTILLAGDITEEHQGKYCLDPIEPDLISSPAVINCNDDSKSIYSFLHGGRKFKIVKPDEAITVAKNVSAEAKELAKKYELKIWKPQGNYANDELRENWQILMQSFIDASKPTFRKQMNLLGIPAGCGKSTGLAYYMGTIKPTGLIVVFTLAAADEMKAAINRLAEEPIAKTYYNNKDQYVSDCTYKNYKDAHILIVTHNRLEQEIRSNNNNLMIMNETDDFGGIEEIERELIVVDESIDFSETATIYIDDLRILIVDDRP